MGSSLRKWPAQLPRGSSRQPARRILPSFVASVVTFCGTNCQLFCQPANNSKDKKCRMLQDLTCRVVKAKG